MEFTREELADVGVDIEDLHEITEILHDHIKWQGEDIRLIDNSVRVAESAVATGTHTLEQAAVIVKREASANVLAVVIPVVAGVLIGGPVGGVVGMSVAAGAIGVGVGGVAGLGIGFGIKKIMERVNASSMING